MEEWLGFSGQDARKSRFWKACDAAKQKRSSGYACIFARVTGAQGTDTSEIEERNCASNCNAGGYNNLQQYNKSPTIYTVKRKKPLSSGAFNRSNLCR
ncbi:hypothetical protein [Vibrio rhizosphaerae]|uniref:hypothetical protein n=1 Tax=Vibrio rhizosphaerae TaxID=398736 RepID=UPI0012F9F1A9|nr:hypothetical protein [Vibrio rhizosphaerae]